MKMERLSQRLHDLELEYRAVLTKALSACAGGRWGLFGHNEHLHSLGAPAELGELRALAETIDRVRVRLGEAPFALHAEFEAARGRADANAPGEPKQAQAWLQRLTSA
jgi:hypothetical protein